MLTLRTDLSPVILPEPAKETDAVQGASTVVPSPPVEEKSEAHGASDANVFAGTTTETIDRPSTPKPNALTLLGLRIGRLFGGPPVNTSSPEPSATAVTPGTNGASDPARARIAATLERMQAAVDTVRKEFDARGGGSFEPLHRVTQGDRSAGAFFEAMNAWEDAMEALSAAAKLPPDDVNAAQRFGLGRELSTLRGSSRDGLTRLTAQFRGHPVHHFAQHYKFAEKAMVNNGMNRRLDPVDKLVKCTEYAMSQMSLDMLSDRINRAMPEL